MPKTLSKDRPWFCFDGDDYEYFKTEDEALEASIAAIEYYLDDSWDDCVENVLVGKVTAVATEVDRESRPDDVNDEGL